MFNPVDSHFGPSDGYLMLMEENGDVDLAIRENGVWSVTIPTVDGVEWLVVVDPVVNFQLDVSAYNDIALCRARFMGSL